MYMHVSISYITELFETWWGPKAAWEKGKYSINFILLFCISKWFPFPLMHDGCKTGQQQTMES